MAFVVAFVVTLFLCLVGPVKAVAADYPPPKEGDYVLQDFTFRSGEKLPELRIHYLVNVRQE